jgi:hypothetical protein
MISVMKVSQIIEKKFFFRKSFTNNFKNQTIYFGTYRSLVHYLKLYNFKQISQKRIITYQCDD